MNDREVVQQAIIAIRQALGTLDDTKYESTEMVRGIEQRVDALYRGICLPEKADAVVLVENENNRKLLAWRASDGTWDVLDGHGERQVMSDLDLVSFGTWRELEAS